MCSCAYVCTRDPPFVARPGSFMTDVDAWAELTEMYLHLHMYKKASFCYESVVFKSHRRRLAAQLLAHRAYALYTPVGSSGLRCMLRAARIRLPVDNGRVSAVIRFARSVAARSTPRCDTVPLRLMMRTSALHRIHVVRPLR